MSTAPVAAAPSSKPWYAKIWAGVVKGEHAVVSAFEKAAAEVPEVKSLAATYGPEVAALSSSIVAGSGKYTTTAVNAVTTIGQLLQDGGAAAEANFINQGFDSGLIADIKSLWGNLKAGAAAAGVGVATPKPVASTAPKV